MENDLQMLLFVKDFGQFLGIRVFWTNCKLLGMISASIYFSLWDTATKNSICVSSKLLIWKKRIEFFIYHRDMRNSNDKGNHTNGTNEMAPFKYNKHIWMYMKSFYHCSDWEILFCENIRIDQHVLVILEFWITSVKIVTLQ